MLDKRQAGMWVKIVALVIAVAFIGAAVLTLLEGVGTYNAPSNTAAASDQQALGLIAGLQAQIKADPKNKALVRQLGDTYYDLALEQQKAKRYTDSGKNFALAAGVYGRYLKLDAKNTGVGTDRATALFYSGDTSGAIAGAQKVLKIDPGFQNALVNLGVFYSSAGDSARAREVWGRYLKLYPNGQAASFVKQALANLK